MRPDHFQTIIIFNSVYYRQIIRDKSEHYIENAEDRTIAGPEEEKSRSFTDVLGGRGRLVDGTR